MKIRVGFTLLGGRSWTGGRNYLVNLLTLLADHQAEHVVPVLFVGTDISNAELLPLSIPGVECIRNEAFNESRQQESLIRALIVGKDTQVSDAFLSNHIDVVFENARFFGWRLQLPVLAWIPDFQHRYLPKLFGRAAYWRREMGFRAQIRSGRTIMLSSEDARVDCERFYPRSIGRTSVVRFAIPPPERLSREEARKVADSYGLPSNYFFLPNQFWKHKNHVVVVDALIALKKAGVNVVVAASGKQHDPRNPEYFSELKSHIDGHGLSSNFRLLGLVPMPHVLSLMLASSGLLNPSLFEGWSTTVEEARATGTPMILSSLRVHREQAGEMALYFDPTSPKDLSSLLLDFVPASADQRRAMTESAAILANERVVSFAREFAAAARLCCEKIGRVREGA